MTKTDQEERYEVPEVVVLGSLARVTLQDKKSGLSDGVYLLTIGPLTNNSV